jgi:endo-1,4-beta-xylanase
VDRWDVVNEPLEHVGGQLDDNVYLERWGPDYIADAFRIASEADPDAELWLNDFSTEIQPAKADALVDLVEQLVADDVPIDGVGFQTHLTVDVPILPGAIAEPMKRIRQLGLDVAITELDVPIGPNRTVADQVELYERAVAECRENDCVEITTWGVTDDRTWLDDPTQRDANPLLNAWSLPSEPLLLDQRYDPKPAYSAVVGVLRRPPNA